MYIYIYSWWVWYGCQFRPCSSPSSSQMVKANPSGPPASRPQAAVAVMKRLDTTQLQASVAFEQLLATHLNRKTTIFGTLNVYIYNWCLCSSWYLIAKQVQKHEEDPDCCLQPDGTYLYRTATGKWETWDQRQHRLQHNQKMAFNRSFRFLASPKIICPRVST